MSLHGHVTAVFLGVVILCADVFRADDQFECCMAGPKQIKSVNICPAQCCLGYHEKYAKIPYTGVVIWCEKEVPRPRGMKRYLYGFS